MSLPFIPAIVRLDDDYAQFEATLPLMPWAIRSSGIGGHAVAASGATAAYVIRTDRIASVTLRLTEAELSEALSILESIRGAGESFTFWFDKDDATTAFEVYLVSPAWPDDLAPERDEAYRELFRLTLELRTADGLPFGLTWTEYEGS